MCVPRALCVAFIKTDVGAHGLDCWDAHPIQRPSSFQVRHVVLRGYTALTDVPAEKQVTRANRLSYLSLIGRV